MKRRTFALGFATVSSASLAGCAGLNPFADAGENDLVGEDGSSSKSDSGDSGGDSGESDTDSGSEPSDGSPNFDADTDTDSIVLRLSDLSDGYEYSGESDIVTAELEDDERDQYASDQIVRQHSRSFRRTDESDNPIIIYSEATVYENADSASAQLSEIEATFQEQSAESTPVELTTGVTASQITYVNDQGTQNVLIYYQKGNLLLLIITSGTDDFHVERARELKIQMISDI
jgi:hypothetical protein